MGQTWIADLHCDTVWEIRAGADLSAGNPDGHIDIERLRKGDVRLQVFACFVSSELPADRAFGETIALLDTAVEACRAHAAELELVEKAVDARSVAASGKTAVILTVENGHALANDPANLELLRRRGVRSMTLTHSKHLEWAASSGETTPGPDGLTPLGEEVIAAMNDLEMVIDVSHVAESTFRDVARLSKKPFIASHSCASALCPIARNLTDDQIKIIADSGGVVGINFFPGFLESRYFEFLLEHCGDLFTMLDRIETEHSDDPRKKISAMHDLGTDLHSRTAEVNVGLERVVDHIEHVVRLVGDEFVAFGSDFDGLPDLPLGMSGCDVYPAIVEMMKKRGFSDESLGRICRENALRVFA